MTPSTIAKCFWVQYSNPDMLSELWSVVGPGPWNHHSRHFRLFVSCKVGLHLYAILIYIIPWYTLYIIAPFPNSLSFWGLFIVDDGMKEGNSPICQAQSSTSTIINLNHNSHPESCFDSHLVLGLNNLVPCWWKKKEGKEHTLLWLYDSAKLKDFLWALWKSASWCLLSKFRGCVGIYSFTSC